MNRLALALVLLVCLFVAYLPAVAGVDARLLRYPDISDSQIAFVYAGDIWVVPKTGGEAHRLSTPSGEESFPRFSPDGSMIAFSGNYDGNTDIYVVPSMGGISRRLTHHPMPERMLDWYPDGQGLLVASAMQSGRQRFSQLYKVPRSGGLPEKLPVPYGEFGTLSPDGNTLAYMPVSRDFRTWKRYRGGTAPDIWLFNLKNLTSENLTRNKSNDSQPMWHGSTLYFQSDRDASLRANIWAHDTKTGETRQITRFTDYDVRFPAIGPKDLVFENGGRLYVMDLDTEKVREVEVQVVTDGATLLPRVKKVGDMMTGGDISPTGQRAVLAARGDIFTLPAEHGPVLDITRTSGVAERYPVWSADGTEIAYFSDRTGEYELTIRNADGSGEETTLTSLGSGYRYSPIWSPDGRKLAFVDQTMTIRIHDRDTEETTAIDQGRWMYHGGLSSFSVSWSADSRWIAYARGLDHRQRAIFLYDTDNNERHQVTSGFYDDAAPAFDPDGNYLYLISGRTMQPSYSDLDNTWIYANTSNLFAVPLRDDVASPLAARNDVEPPEEDEEDGEEDDDEGDQEDDGDDEDSGDEGEGEDEAEGEGDDDEDDEDEVEPVEIDLEGFERRMIALPPDAGNYTDLAAVSGKLLYRRLPRTGSGGETSPLVYFDFEEREEETILDDCDGYAVSHDGNKLLVAQNGSLAIVDLAPKAKLETKLRTAEMEMVVDPMAEWQQIFLDAWRLNRDFFYDPNLHGRDWNEMRKRYGKLLEDAVTRWDVNFIIGELIGELNSSHTYRGGGDTERAGRHGIGLLGCDFSLENGAYRIAKIIDGAAWDNSSRSPLAEPGLDVKEGDYLLAVNGVPLETSTDPWAAFAGLAGKTVILSVNDKPEMDEARDVLVKTMNSETRLRNLAWIEDKRRRVEEATDGRVGYVYVPSTGRGGQTELVRMFRAQTSKDAMIIDERFNSGGQIPDRFIELLNRPLYNYWRVRDGQDWQWPPVAHVGPKVMLINQWSGSGGDALPYYFREAGLGPLIGTRTWGGLIGLSGIPLLIDGGVVTVPTFSIYSTDGEWIIENHGVDPDIEVVDDPALMVDGGDPQLDRAIEEILRMLAENPPVQPEPPAYPVR